MTAASEPKYRTFREILKTPSAALKAMCDGLEKQSRRKDFIVDMGTFGSREGKVCFGCAATCATQQASGIDLTLETIENEDERSDRLAVDYSDLNRFEIAMNAARLGCLRQLFYYFNSESKYLQSEDGRYCLDNDNWHDELPKVLAHIAELQSAGL